MDCLCWLEIPVHALPIAGATCGRVLPLKFKGSFDVPTVVRIVPDDERGRNPPRVTALWAVHMCKLLVSQVSVSIDVDAQCFAERARPAGVGYPENGIIRGLRIRMAAQVRQVDKAGWPHRIRFNPFKDGTEVSSTAAFWLQPHGFRWFEFLRRLPGRVAIHHVNGVRLCLIRNRRNLARELFEFAGTD